MAIGAVMMATKDWEPADPATAAGRLTRREESEIRQTLRPIKRKTQQQSEADDQADRADTHQHPHDRLPLKLHSRSLSDSGVPDIAEVFLRYLSGEHARTPRDRQIEVVLMEMQRLNRPLWTLLEEHFFYKQSFRQIAGQMRLSHEKVRLIIVAGLLDIQKRRVELFGTDA